MAVIQVDINFTGQRTLLQVKDQIKQVDIALQAAYASGADTSKLESRLTELKDEFGELKNAIKAANPEELLNGIVKMTQGVMGGFAAATGAIGVFGDESKEVQEIQKKSAAVIQVLIGLEQFRARFLEKSAQQENAMYLKNIANQIRKIFVTETEIVATEGATVAQEGLNVAMKANPIGIVVTAVLALVGAIALFIANTDDAIESQEEKNKLDLTSIKIQDDLKKSYNDVSESITKLGIEYDVLTGKITQQQADILNIDMDTHKKRLDLGYKVAELRLQIEKTYNEQVQVLALKYTKEGNVEKLKDLKENSVKYFNETVDRLLKENKAYKEIQEQQSLLTAENEAKKDIVKQKASKKATDDQLKEYQRMLKLIEGEPVDEVLPILPMTDYKEPVDKYKQMLDEINAANQASFDYNEWLREQKKKKDDEDLEKEKEKKKALKDLEINAANELASGILDINRQNQQIEFDERQQRISDFYNTEKSKFDKQLKDKVISQSEYDSKVKQLEIKKQNEERKLKIDKWNSDKQNALSEIAIGTSVAFVKALPNLLLAASVATIGAIQAGLVLAQPMPKFAKGAVNIKGDGTSTSDSIVARISNGESIINAESTRRFAPLLKSINEGNDIIDYDMLAMKLGKVVNDKQVINVASETYNVNNKVINAKNRLTY